MNMINENFLIKILKLYILYLKIGFAGIAIYLLSAIFYSLGNEIITLTVLVFLILIIFFELYYSYKKNMLWKYRFNRMRENKPVLPLFAEMTYYYLTPKEWREELLGTVQEIYFEKYEISSESAYQWLVSDLSGSIYPLLVWRLKSIFSFKRRENVPDGWFEFLKNKTVN